VGERQSVELTADGGDGRGSSFGEGERRGHRPGPFEQHLAGTAAGVRRHVRRRRQRERRQRQLPFRAETQRRPARGEDDDAWAGIHQPSDIRGGGEQVFQVVEHQETGAAAEVGGDDRPGSPAAALGNTQDLGDGGQHQRRVAHGGELDHRHRAAERRRRPSARLDRQPRLADATRSGEGEQPSTSRGQRGDDVSELAPASEHRRSGVAGRPVPPVGYGPGGGGQVGGGQVGALRLVEV
jgi:hypothetical protein